MERLSSYFIYVFVFIFPAPLGAIVYFNFDEILKGDAGSIFGVIVFSAATSFFAFTISRTRRVFYKDSTLYLYGLFSSRQVIITKDNIGGINRISVLDQSNYKIIYYDENKDTKCAYFTKNWLCDDFDTIVDALNY